MKKSLVLISILFSASAFAADGVAHLPKAPSWDYGAKGGSIAVGAVGNDYCNMDTGDTCDGANVLISGQAAEIIFNTMGQSAVAGLKKSKGIECLQDAQKKVKCLFHVGANGPEAGETPWISD